MSRKIKEPVQVYLEPADRDILDAVARQTGLSRAEVLRRGLRHYGAEKLARVPAGSALEGLIGILGDDPSIPDDLSVRHDEYLYGTTPRGRGRGRKRAH